MISFGPTSTAKRGDEALAALTITGFLPPRQGVEAPRRIRHVGAGHSA